MGANCVKGTSGHEADRLATTGRPTSTGFDDQPPVTHGLNNPTCNVSQLEDIALVETGSVITDSAASRDARVTEVKRMDTGKPRVATPKPPLTLERGQHTKPDQPLEPPRRPQTGSAHGPHLPTSEHSDTEELEQPMDMAPSGKKIFKAIANFDSGERQDLPFKKGERFEYISEVKNWWMVRRISDMPEVGRIPKSHVVEEQSDSAYEWFHGDIGRLEAEQRLMATGRPGSFLIRTSSSHSGSYSLSNLCLDNYGRLRVKHFIIYQNRDGYSMLRSATFKTLVQLVEGYQFPALSFCVLETACPRPIPVAPDLSSEWQDVFEIPRSSLVIGHKLGGGKFGEVKLAVWSGVMHVAVKIARGFVRQEQFRAEAAIMKTLQHENIVRLYGMCSDRPIYIVTEYMPNGSLLHYLQDVSGPGHQLEFHVHMFMAKQIAAGMAFIERMGLIHRDLSARNVLVGENNTVRITDFGLARTLTDEDYLAVTGSPFPVRWTALEGILEHRFSIKSDVWSFGITLVEIITNGGVPYPGDRPMTVQRKVMNGYVHPQPTECPNSLYDVMTLCWKTEPKERPSFQELIVELGKVVQRDHGNYQNNDSPEGTVIAELRESPTDRPSVPADIAAGQQLSRINRIIENIPYFHGYMTTMDTYTLLITDENIQGHYLLRRSPGHGGCLVLSVTYVNDAGKLDLKHYFIEETGDGQFCLFGRQFAEISNLVAHCSVVQELCCLLRQPCNRVSAIRPKSYTLPTEAVIKTHFLAHGNYSEVWKGTLYGAVPVAIKVPTRRRLSHDLLEREAMVLQKLEHAHIVHFYGLCASGEDGDLYIITEWMEKGSLRSYLKLMASPRHQALSDDQLFYIAEQVANGMAYVEEMNFVHRDLAARNVLVQGDNIVKIADFGLARGIAEGPEAPDSANLAVKWTAPEVLSSQGYTIKSDVWSFGVLLVELVTGGQTPYPDLDQSVVATKVLGGFRHPQPPATPSELYLLMLDCWSAKDSLRPSFVEIQQRIHRLRSR